MNRFPALRWFLALVLVSTEALGVDVVVMSQCSAHGIRPQSDMTFCRDCGALHGPKAEECRCGSDELLSMCDLCAVEFGKRGRVPVESAN